MRKRAVVSADLDASGTHRRPEARCEGNWEGDFVSRGSGRQGLLTTPSRAASIALHEAAEAAAPAVRLQFLAFAGDWHAQGGVGHGAALRDWGGRSK